MDCGVTATASGRSDLRWPPARRDDRSPRIPSAGRLTAIGFLLTPLALGFLASALYFPSEGADEFALSGPERRGERRSSEVAGLGTAHRLYNPANLCAAGASCSRVERHDKRYARRIIPRSSASKSSTYGSGQYVGLRRN